MSLDAMKQALEALEFIGDAAGRNAITALRLAIQKEEALSALIAESQALGAYDVPKAERREPVAWEPKIETQYQDGFVVSQRVKRTPDGPWEDCTTPPQHQPLTEQEIMDAWKQVYEPGHRLHVLANSLARAIERKHGIGGGE